MQKIKVLRQSERSVCYLAEHDGNKVFYKTSPFAVQNEKFFCDRFKLACPTMIPSCVYASDGEIAYEYLSGYKTATEGYTFSVVKKLVDFVKRNQKINDVSAFDKNDEIIKISSSRATSQVEYFYSAIERAKKTVDVSADFENDVSLAINDFTTYKTLCHGDLGKSNVLLRNDDVKIIDYEYSLFSVSEFDLGRILSTQIVSYFIKPYIDFDKSVNLLYAESDFLRLNRLTALQLIMRTKFCEQLNDVNVNELRFALRLLSNAQKIKGAKDLIRLINGEK